MLLIHVRFPTTYHILLIVINILMLVFTDAAAGLDFSWWRPAREIRLGIARYHHNHLDLFSSHSLKQPFAANERAWAVILAESSVY